MQGWSDRIVAAVIGGLVTFAAMYITVVGRYAPRDEISRMIAVESPYVRDAKWIEKELSSLSLKMDSMNKKLDLALGLDPQQ